MRSLRARRQRENGTDQRIQTSRESGQAPSTADGSGGIVRKQNPKFPPFRMSVPVDHFHNDSRYEPHSDEMFDLWYWIDYSYYQPGAPVFLFQAGENLEGGQSDILEKGMLHDLKAATGGMLVVLEHRYYGNSIPTKDLSTQNLRFLSTEQAVADMAYFAKNIKYAGLESQKLTAADVPYIVYGAGYGGTLAAIARKIYPDVFWASIASSAIVEPIADMWSYYEPIRVYADQKCIAYQQKVVNMIDNILLRGKNPAITARLKGAFGLASLTHEDDFAHIATAMGVTSWQRRNWAPDQHDPDFDEFCGNITSSHVLHENTKRLRGTVADLITAGGYGSEVGQLSTPLMNWIGWMANFLQRCRDSLDNCYSLHDRPLYQLHDLEQIWRPWFYQVCTEWGLWTTGASYPQGQLPLISRVIDLDYSSQICKHAYGITTPPNLDAVRKYGGFKLSYPRLAFIDGEQDPWRPVGVHASPFNPTALNRTDTASEPFLLIPGAGHHWDVNGVLPHERVDYPPNYLPPPMIRDAQSLALMYVQQWLMEWEVALMSKNQKREEE
ncbi:hypothetical protein QTJ16_005813 [Diplocarpon rosae]|uniref:Uncharacterized protein n=1 Tax=Diplocarpon rosae TaxID=946125 RepID=A0AAD9SXS0_9HELO|nr:hypothetical protein QTJ16_005813 [Diplocarpon rosae]